MPNTPKKGPGITNSPTISQTLNSAGGRVTADRNRRGLNSPLNTALGRDAIQVIGGSFNPSSRAATVRRREDTPAPRATPAANQTQVEKKFGDAFSAARKSGVKAFTWQGKSYSTEVARPPANRAGNPPRPARNSREFSNRANRAASPTKKK